MVAAVDKVEFAPLASGERTDEGMVQQFGGCTELRFALGDDVIHFRDFGLDLGDNVLRRKSARPGHGRRFPARRKIAERHHDKRLATLFPRGFRSQGFAGFKDAAKALDAPGVGQVEMLEDFSGAPLAGSVLGQLFGRKSGNGRRDFLLQSRQGPTSVTHLLQPFS